MFWFCGILAGLLVSAADIFLLTRERKASVCIHAVLRDTVLTVLSALAVMQYGLKIVGLFHTELHGALYPLKFFALVLGIGAVGLFARSIIEGVITFARTEPKHKAGAMAARIVSTVFFALGTAAFTGTLWGKDTFGDMTPDQMLINLNSPIEGTSTEVMDTLFTGPVLQTAFLTAVFCLFVFSPRKIQYCLHEKKHTVFSGLARRIVSFILAVVVLAGGVTFGVQKFQLQKLYAAYMSASPYIEDNFVDPTADKLKFPEKKRNLIHIYLESMENSYFSKELGGYMEENLMPDLAELSKDGYNFSHLADGFGGPPWTSGGHWSVASMVNMGTGLPMKVPVDGNAYGAENNFLPGAIALGDILKEQGYEQTVMFGADANFGGLNFYYTSHGNFNIIDWRGAKERGLIPEDYSVWWGYEDDKLYEFAKQELTRLSETGKPFHFCMETADTHFPDGYQVPGMPTPYESPYANVILYSQEQTVKFVRWIQQQPFYKNTTIVLIGDHMSMDQKFFEGFDPNYKRTTFNLILNPAPNVRNISDSRLHNRDWANFDMFPTMLASIGVEIEGNRLGIGTNLFSDEQTLFERDGIDTVNAELEKRSNFYNENILVPRKK